MVNKPERIEDEFAAVPRDEREEKSIRQGEMELKKGRTFLGMKRRFSLVRLVRDSNPKRRNCVRKVRPSVSLLLRV